MKQVKVLHYAPGFLSGGIESRLLDWYRNIDRTKIKFYLIKLNSQDDTYNIQEFKKLGGEVYNLPALNTKNIIQYSVQINKIIKDGKFDVIHVHDIGSGIFPLFLSKIHGINSRIMHSRTTEFLPTEKNLLIKKILKKMLVFFSTEYFACSKEAGIWAFGKGKQDEMKVIKNGVQVEKFAYINEINQKIKKDLKLTEGVKVIGTISRLSPQKNISFLIEVFSKVYETQKNVVLLIVGDGPIKKELLNQVEKLSIRDNVIFVGEKSNVEDYYMTFDLFLATSFYEGFGTTAIESQAAGIPTILSTGFPEVVAITDLVKRIDLDTDIEIWVKEIIAKLGQARNLNAINEITDAGYSAMKTAKYLEKKYLQKGDYFKND